MSNNLLIDYQQEGVWFGLIFLKDIKKIPSKKDIFSCGYIFSNRTLHIGKRLKGKLKLKFINF